MRTTWATVLLALTLLVAIGVAEQPGAKRAITTRPAADRRSAGPGTAFANTAARAPAQPQALVTDEAQNRLLVVDLPSGRIARSVSVPADPEDIATSGNGGVVVVVSSSAGKVTILNRDTLKIIKTFGGFEQPHIAAISPDGSYAYITDDARGTLTVIRLSDMKIVDTVSVGIGAHHLAFSPTERTVWVALGENAQQITTLSTVTSRPAPPSSPVVNPGRPRVTGHFTPGFPAHDLAFSPDGRSIWITSATGSDVTAFDARTHQSCSACRWALGHSISSSRVRTRTSRAVTAAPSRRSTPQPAASSPEPARRTGHSNSPPPTAT